MTDFQDAALGLQFIKRYHMRDLNRQQNVAEHSYNVTMLVLETALWLERFNTDFSDSRVLRMITRALLHDLPEYFTGDLDYWVKAKLKDAWTDMEKGAIKGFVEDLPDYMGPTIRTAYMFSKPGYLDYCVVKQADYLELTHFCMSEYRRGNKKAKSMIEKGLTVTRRYEHDALKDESCPLRMLETHLWLNLNMRKKLDVMRDVI